MACHKKDRSSGTAPNEMSRAGFRCPPPKYSSPLLQDGKSSGSAPRGACMQVLFLRHCISARGQDTCRNSPAEASFRGNWGWCMNSGSGSPQQALLPLNPGCLMGMAVTVWSLHHGSMGRVLFTSMANFKIIFHCNSSADLYSE